MQRVAFGVSAEVKMAANTHKRLEWVDILKGILIILVVIGHTTGIFNQFIYQFHMAGFFIISGYTTVLSKRNLFQTLYSKIRTLLIPFFTIFLLLAGVMFLLHHLGIYRYFFDEATPYVGIPNILANFFRTGDNYVYWLGATWFIIVLFGANIFHKIVYQCTQGHLFWMGLLSVSALLLGYVWVAKGWPTRLSFFPVDLILIGQFYFFVGIFIRQRGLIAKTLLGNKTAILALMIFSAVLMYFLSIYSDTVDYPSRRFNFLPVDVLAAVNGTIFAICVSLAIAHSRLQIGKSILQYLGKNTLPILLFHFIGIKISYIILYLVGIMPAENLRVFLVSDPVFWPFSVAVAIAVSLLFWLILLKIKWLRHFIAPSAQDIAFGETLEEKTKCLTTKIRNGIEPVYVKIRGWMSGATGYTALILVVALGLLYHMGETVNDELIAHLYREDGLLSMFRFFVHNELRMGRPMRILAAVNYLFGFLTTSTILNGLIRIGILLLCLWLLYLFLKTITNNKKFALFTVAAAGLFLPINFEHSAPTAFVGLTVVPICYLLLSLYLFVRYLEDNSRKKIVLSIIFWYLALLSYEYMVTFVLLYPVLAFGYTRSVPATIKKAGLSVLAGILYLALMLLTQGTTTEAAYSGAQIGFVSLQQSWEILQNLFLISLPCAYLFIPKYQYILLLYQSNFTIWGMLRLVLLVVLIILFVSKLVKTKAATQEKPKPSLLYLAVAIIGLFYTFIPSLPNSIASMYQNNVHSGAFLGLPVSFSLFLAMTVSLCAFLWFLLQKANASVTCIALAAFLLLAIPQQYENAVLAKEGAKEFQRIETIEEFLHTDTIRSMEGGTIAAPDLFQTRNTLAVKTDHWSQYMQMILDSSTQVVSTDAQGGQAQVYYPDDAYFVVIPPDGQALLLSSTPIDESESHVVLDADNVPHLLTVQSPDSVYEDGEFLVYPVAPPLQAIEEDVGQNRGLHHDNWVGDAFEIVVRTDESGEIELECYCPYPVDGTQTGVLYVEGQEIPFAYEEGVFRLTAKAEPNSIVSIMIRNNYTFSTEEDPRELAYLLSSINGETL